MRTEIRERGGKGGRIGGSTSDMADAMVTEIATCGKYINTPPLFSQSPEGKGLRGKVLIAMELAPVLRG
jgi:hypothetical protein